MSQGCLRSNRTLRWVLSSFIAFIKRSRLGFRCLFTLLRRFIRRQKTSDNEPKQPFIPPSSPSPVDLFPFDFPTATVPSHAERLGAEVCLSVQPSNSLLPLSQSSRPGRLFSSSISLQGSPRLSAIDVRSPSRLTQNVSVVSLAAGSFRNSNHPPSPSLGQHDIIIYPHVLGPRAQSSDQHSNYSLDDSDAPHVTVESPRLDPPLNSSLDVSMPDPTSESLFTRARSMRTHLTSRYSSSNVSRLSQATGGLGGTTSGEMAEPAREVHPQQEGIVIGPISSSQILRWDRNVIMYVWFSSKAKIS
jgi:hypothetical protein